MLNFQHNKMIVVDGPSGQMVVCGSTNFRWRGFFVQSNNALVLRGTNTVERFLAFEGYWSLTPATFGEAASANWTDLGLPGIQARVTFSPHGPSNASLKTIADDIETNTTSSLFFSLAFLYQTPGVILNAIKKVSQRDEIFVYGISDRKVGGLDLQKPDGNVAPVFPAALTKNVIVHIASGFTGLPVIRLQINLASGSFLNGCSFSQSLTYGNEHVSKIGPVPVLAS
jgi:hypothetical protein